MEAAGVERSEHAQDKGPEINSQPVIVRETAVHNSSGGTPRLGGLANRPPDAYRRYLRMPSRPMMSR